MIKRIILALSIFLSVQSFAGKTYQLTLKIQSLATGEMLEGIKISTSIKDEIVEVGRTNSEGVIVLSELREKTLNIIVEDPSDYHRKDHLFYSNFERVDEEETFGLRLVPVHETAFFTALDQQYIDTFNSVSEAEQDRFVGANPRGGMAGLQLHIAKNLEYPEDAILEDAQGKVYLSFIIQADGTLTHVKIERGVSPSLDKEAIRLLRYTGKWKPATLNGTPIPTKMRVPINFTLN